MGIGSGIFLVIAGAIVRYALKFNVKWVNQDLIGYLLMGGGALVFLISLVVVFKKNSTTVTTHSAVNPGSGEKNTIAETKSSS
jgi:hypothetical protein